MKNHSRNIGRNRGAARLWLEGKILAAAGWARGDRFHARFHGGRVVYERKEDGARRVAGTTSRPIVDTNTNKLARALGGALRVRIQVTATKVIITAMAALAGLAYSSRWGRGSKRVLVACEYSGRVRDAFAARGHFASSCDVLPSDAAGGLHLQEDLAAVLAQGWDTVIAFPPCTYLCSAGAWRNLPKHDPDGVRAAKAGQALDFVRMILDCEAPEIALENPVGIISSHVRRPDQIIQPYQFGDPESKKTCLWLRGLAPLVPTNTLAVHQSGRWTEQGWRWRNQTASGQSNVGETADRWKKRSTTYRGIAAAMAAQWG